MKKLVFLFLILLLLGFNFSCSKKNDFEKTSKKIDFEKIMKICKNMCSKYNNNNPDFCNRICEKEIFDPRWKFFIFDEDGSAWFFDPESISTFHDIVSVWVKIIVSERVRQNGNKKIRKKLENSILVYCFFKLIMVYCFFKLIVLEKKYDC
ncbi:MAG: hypothetical protein LM575_00845 [Caldimicrobium sp.]|nr:hypothetical protein [Caldimicrobium sp.]